MKTPGVYIVEKNAFPNAVVEVATAVPAFVGYTQIHEEKGRSLKDRPWRITSMAEFETLFGTAPEAVYTLSTSKPTRDPLAPLPPGPRDPVASPGGKDYYLRSVGPRFLLHSSMHLFFQNGGGACYVVSVGDYGHAPDVSRLQAGIQALAKEQEPTMLVIPDAVLLEAADCARVQMAALEHCGRMRNRVAILDLHRGHLAAGDPHPLKAFRDGVRDAGHRDFGAAYHPWLETTLVQARDVGFRHLDATGRAALKTILEDEGLVPADLMDGLERTDAELARDEDGARALDGALRAMSPVFKTLVESIVAELNLLPPSGAMAGVYTMVDNTRGVWKAPANVGLNGVVRPAVDLSHEEQEELNVSPDGVSVNAIRSFPGEGTLVWGARTLEGNSLDWRYISVRRTMIMLEQSIRLAAKAYVFEANDSGTWATIRSMIGNFLTGIWKQGGLAGASPDDAFSVRLGLGETMTSEDVLEGILRVSVLVAVTRPAEFIEITVQQQMQVT